MSVSGAATGGAARRVRVLLAVLLSGLLLIAGRLSYLQLLHGPTYLQLSQANVQQPERLVPLRGRILARDGTVLADNWVAVDLLYRGGEIPRWPRLSDLLGLSEAPRAPDPSDPEARGGVVLAWNLPDERVSAVAELISGAPNLYLRRRIERNYPTGLAAHAVGYTGEADPGRAELDRTDYAPGDLVGRLSVDSWRRTLAQMTVAAPQPGRDVVLTLDIAAQRAAERILAGALPYVNAERVRGGLPPARSVRGALLAMNPQTGEILALASAPSFDPNVFVRRPVSPQRVGALLNGPAAPLTNRAVSPYPPASTFKVVSSLALLEGGYLTPETRLPCSPSFAFGGTLMRNWSPEDRGDYTVRQALADSCNTFFWHAAATTPGVAAGWGELSARLAQTATELGYGQRLGIGLPEEQPGRVPDAAWAERFYGHPWLPGHTMNLMIGQGDLLATPLQVLQLTGTVALGGERVAPQLVARVGDTPSEITVRSQPGAWRVVQAGLREMVTDYAGRWLLGPEVFSVAVAGKTGTAQNAGADHAWFMGYGPLENPDLAVVVFIEHGGPSSAVTLPVARDFMQAYWAQTGRLAQHDP